jgi:hypothetical protein
LGVYPKIDPGFQAVALVELQAALAQGRKRQRREIEKRAVAWSAVMFGERVLASLLLLALLPFLDKSGSAALNRRIAQGPARGEEEIRLTPAEYNLLAFFLNHPDRPLTREMILNSVWGYSFASNTRTVDAHILKLRQKLEAEPNVPRHFLTVHGVGYRFLP